MPLGPEYHTLREGIPARAKGDRTRIGMDTGNMRNWLHLWISGTAVGPKSDLDTFKGSMHVHLSREDAANLIEEIKARLF